jgi:Chromate transporter
VSFRCTKFGSPLDNSMPALLKVFVEKRKWLSAQLFLELLALCQFMPGPTSTQQAYAMGVTQQGVTGGFVSGTAPPNTGTVNPPASWAPATCLTLPSCGPVSCAVG